MAAIETEKFQNMVRAIGSDTLASIANAGPEMQVWNPLRSVLRKKQGQCSFQNYCPIIF